jgi:hypothetical protein
MCKVIGHVGGNVYRLRANVELVPPEDDKRTSLLSNGKRPRSGFWDLDSVGPEIVLSTEPTTDFFADLSPYMHRRADVGGWDKHASKAVAEAFDSTLGDAPILRMVAELNERTISEYQLMLQRHPRRCFSTRVEEHPDLVSVVPHDADSTRLAIKCNVCARYSLVKHKPMMVNRNSFANFAHRHLKHKGHIVAEKYWKDIESDDVGNAGDEREQSVAGTHRGWWNEYLGPYWVNGNYQNGPKEEYRNLQVDAAVGELWCNDPKCKRKFFKGDELLKNPWNAARNIMLHCDARRRRMENNKEAEVSGSAVDAVRGLFGQSAQAAPGVLSNTVSDLCGLGASR